MSSVDENIPEDWVETTLGEVGLEVLNGFAFKSKNFLNEEFENVLPVLKIKNVANGDANLNDIVYHKFSDSLEKYRITKGDTLIALTGNHPFAKTQVVGGVSKYRINKDSLLNQRVAKIYSKPNSNLANELIYYYFKWRVTKFYIGNQSSGSASQANISKTDLLNIPINLPPLPEQKAIANILKALDDKIENLQAQNKTLEQTAKTIFKEWFGKYQNQNEVPLDMSLGSLDDFIGVLESGKRPKGGVGQFVEGIPSVGAENVKNLGVYDYSKTKYVPEEFFNKMSSGIVKDYDILIYKDGGTPGTFIPHFTIVGEGFPFSKFCINEHVFRIQPKFKYQRFYLYSWLDSYYCRKLLQNIGGKAAIPGINSSDLREIEILIPSEESLKHFNKVVQPMYKKLLINSRNIKTLQKTRDTLLPKLMSGALRVSEGGQIRGNEFKK
ncbi:restriction endonuclease subunit S [uncultured Aquimarina sp.]|uniref:restriction endonuclease subunit S n=1 Tax=uncultured Aquimarina sp. TaxID=575652 RepID=UPI00261203F5|nr:restriction endonuclease subunit S [uncultured Aquimarina sp.]